MNRLATLQRAWSLCLLLSACSRTQSSPRAHEPSPIPSNDVVSVDVSSREDARIGIDRLDVFMPRDVAPDTREVTSSVTLERAAGPDLEHLVAVGNGHLYRLEDKQWTPVALQGVEVHDVVFDQGAFWVLARALPTSSKRGLIVRYSLDGSLSVVGSIELRAQSEPRALVMVSPTEFYVAGADPALIRWKLGYTIIEPAVRDPVVSLRRTRSDFLLARPEGSDARLVVFRWNSASSVPVTQLRDVLLDKSGSAFVLRDRGILQPINRDALGVALTTPAPFSPDSAAIRDDGSLVIASIEGVAWFAKAWRRTQTPLPSKPIAVLPSSSNSLQIVCSNGSVFTLNAENLLMQRR